MLRHITDPLPHLGSPFFSNPTWKNLEPRVGFSWDPNGNGHTSIRGGFGLFDVLPLPYLYEWLSTSRVTVLPIGECFQLIPGTFPGGLFSQIGNASNLRQSYVQPNPGRNYVMQWNLNVQHQFAYNVSS